MKMPCGEHAIIDVAKLLDYCLSPDHELGKHKARVFEEALRINQSNWERLRDGLLGAVCSNNAIPAASDRYGDRYLIDFEMAGPLRTATVRSAWIIRTGETSPRLVTCYIIE